VPVSHVSPLKHGFEQSPICCNRRYNENTGIAMDKTIRKLASFKEAKDEEYRYWQSVK